MHSPELSCSSLTTKFAGLGALCSPLIATQFSEQRHWSFHYLTSLDVALINLIAQCTVLRFRTQEGGRVLSRTCALNLITVFDDV